MSRKKESYDVDEREPPEVPGALDRAVGMKYRGIHLDVHAGFDADNEPVLLSLLDVVEGLDRDFREAYTGAIARLPEETLSRHARAIAFAKDRKMDRLTFEIYSAEQAQHDKIADPAYYEDRPAHAPYLLNLQLPPQLAHLWRKTIGARWGSESLDAGAEMPWGEIYRNTMPSIWKYTESLEGTEGNMQLRRYNDFGTHDPNAYYYLYWVVESEDDGGITEQARAAARSMLGLMVVGSANVGTRPSPVGRSASGGRKSKTNK